MWPQISGSWAASGIEKANPNNYDEVVTKLCRVINTSSNNNYYCNGIIETFNKVGTYNLNILVIMPR